jgi:hypothetical protein
MEDLAEDLDFQMYLLVQEVKVFLLRDLQEDPEESEVLMEEEVEEELVR